MNESLTLFNCLKILSRIFLENGSVFVLLLGISMSGELISRKLLGNKNIFLKLGSSIIIGLLVYLFLLSIFSWFFKSVLSNIIISSICIIIGYIDLLKIIKINKFKRNINLSDVVSLIFVFLYLFIFLFRIALAPIGADAQIYFGVANSFVSGNYPISLPWQPDFLSVYHNGTYIIEGSLSTISGIGIYTTHILLSFVLLLSLLLIIIGIAREYHKGLRIFLPFIFGIILFSWPIILLRGLSSFFKTVFYSLANLSISDITKYPQLLNFRASLGAGAMNVNDLIYINFSLFGLAAFLIFLLILIVYSLNRRQRYGELFILVCIMVLTASIDETYFLIEIPLFLYYLKTIFWGSPIRSILRKISFITVIFLSLFFIIQNPIRDSFLTPSYESSRFKFILPNNPKILGKLGLSENEQYLKIATTDVWNYMKAKSIFVDKTEWYLPDLKVVIIVTLFLALFLKEKWAVLLSIASLFSVIYGLVVVNTFWPPNDLRFITKAWQLISVASAFVILDLLNKKGLFRVVAILALVIVLPNIIVSHANLIKGFMSLKYEYYVTSPQNIDIELSKIKNIIPQKSRVLFIDGYPFKEYTGFSSMYAGTRYGILTATSPIGIKILMPDDIGIDWQDAVTNLNPRSLRNMKIDYLYIASGEDSRFSEERKMQLQDKSYFNVIFSDNSGMFYKVYEKFYNIEDHSNTLIELVKMIPDSSVIYFDKLVRGIPRT